MFKIPANAIVIPRLGEPPLRNKSFDGEVGPMLDYVSGIPLNDGLSGSLGSFALCSLIDGTQFWTTRVDIQ
jgi:hypothetical protein